jgi:hypothetical protein
MIPYKIIKEVNPERMKGSATDAINFLSFGVTAVIGPIFAGELGKTPRSSADPAAHFRDAGIFWMGAIALALLLSLMLKETGRPVTAGASDAEPHVETRFFPGAAPFRSLRDQ